MTPRLDGIFCDDIRHEVNNKLTIIGMYSTSMNVGAFPAEVRLATLLIIDGVSVGNHEFAIKVTTPSRTFDMTGQLRLLVPERVFLPVPPLPVSFQEEGEIQVSCTLDGTEISQKLVLPLRLDATLIQSAQAEAP